MNIKLRLAEEEELEEGPMLEFVFENDEVHLKEEESKGKYRTDLCSSDSPQTQNSDTKP